jgi:hypothetical protein
MLFLFDNNGIDYWINNNINDCCNPNVSHNTYQNVEYKINYKACISKQDLYIKDINNNKQNKNTNNKQTKNINNKQTKNTNSKTNYNNLDDKYKLKYMQELLYKKPIICSSIVACGKSKSNSNMRYICIDSYEQPKLINL